MYKQAGGLTSFRVILGVHLTLVKILCLNQHFHINPLVLAKKATKIGSNMLSSFPESWKKRAVWIVSVYVIILSARGGRQKPFYYVIHYVISPDFCEEFQNYTFDWFMILGNYCESNQKNNFFTYPDTYRAAILVFTKWLVIFLSVSQLPNNSKEWFWQLNNHFLDQETNGINLNKLDSTTNLFYWNFLSYWTFYK